MLLCLFLHLNLIYFVSLLITITVIIIIIMTFLFHIIFSITRYRSQLKSLSCLRRSFAPIFSITFLCKAVLIIIIATNSIALTLNKPRQLWKIIRALNFNNFLFSWRSINLLLKSSIPLKEPLSFHEIFLFSLLLLLYLSLRKMLVN